MAKVIKVETEPGDFVEFKLARMFDGRIPDHIIAAEIAASIRCYTKDFCKVSISDNGDGK